MRNPLSPQVHKILTTITPFLLIAVFVVSTVLIVRSVQTQSQDSRSRAEGVYPSAATTLSTTLATTLTLNPTKTPADIQALLNKLGDGSNVSGGCGASKVAIGPGNNVFGCGGDGKWHDLTKGDAYTNSAGIGNGIGPEYLTIKPVWLEGSKTLAAAIQNAAAVRDYTETVKVFKDAGLVVPTPEASKSPCGGNGDSVFSSGAVVVGPISNGNSTWQCSNGSWNQCPNCIITEVPAYLADINEFKKRYITNADDLKVFNAFYDSCSKINSSSACRDVAIAQVMNDRQNRALAVMKNTTGDCASSITECGKALTKLGLTEAQMASAIQSYNLQLAQKKIYKDEYQPKLSSYLACSGFSVCDIARTEALAACQKSGYSRDQCVQMVANALATKTAFYPAVDKYAACGDPKKMDCILLRGIGRETCMQAGNDVAWCEQQLDTAMKNTTLMVEEYIPAMQKYNACADEACRQKARADALFACAKTGRTDCSDLIATSIADYAKSLGAITSNPYRLLTEGGLKEITTACSTAKNHTCSAQEVIKYEGELASKLTQAQIESNTLLKDLAVSYQSDQNWNNAYEQYKKDHPSETITFEAFQKKQEESWTRIATDLKGLGAEEASLAKYKRGELMPTDLEKTVSAEKGNLFLGFIPTTLNGLLLTLNTITNGAILKNNVQVVITSQYNVGRVALLYEIQDQFTRLQNLSTLSQTTAYKQWIALPDNKTKSVADYQKVQLTAYVQSEDNLKTVGIIRDETKTAYINKVLTGQIDQTKVQQTFANLSAGEKFALAVGNNSITQSNVSETVKGEQRKVAGSFAYDSVDLAIQKQTQEQIVKKPAYLEWKANEEKSGNKNTTAADYQKAQLTAMFTVKDTSGKDITLEFDELGILNGNVDMITLNKSLTAIDSPTFQNNPKLQNIPSTPSIPVKEQKADVIAHAYVQSISDSAREQSDTSCTTSVSCQNWIKQNPTKTLDDYRTEQVKAYLLVKDSMTNLLSAGNFKFSAAEVMNGVDAVGIKKQLDEANLFKNPLVWAAVGLNNFTNGSLLRGHLLVDSANSVIQQANAVLSKTTETAEHKRLAQESISSAYWDIARGVVMQTAKPVGTVLALTLPGTQWLVAARAGTMLTSAAVLNLAGGALGTWMTGDSLSRTAEVCTGRVDQDNLSCGSSVAMSVFSGLSTVTSLASSANLIAASKGFTAANKALGTMDSLVDVAGAGTTVVKSGAAISDDVLRVQLVAAAETAALKVSQAAMAEMSGQTLQTLNKVVSAASIPTFGLQTAEACQKEGFGTSCLLNAAFLFVSVGKVFTPTNVLTPSSKTVITAVDKGANIGMALTACAAAVRGQGNADQCVAAISGAGLALGGPHGADGKPTNMTPDEWVARSIDEAVAFKNAKPTDKIFIGGEEVMFTKENSAELYQRLQSQYRGSILASGMEQAQITMALKQTISKNTTKLTEVESYLTEAQKNYTDLFDSQGKALDPNTPASKLASAKAELAGAYQVFTTAKSMNALQKSKLNEELAQGRADQAWATVLETTPEMQNARKAVETLQEQLAKAKTESNTTEITRLTKAVEIATGNLETARNQFTKTAVIEAVSSAEDALKSLETQLKTAKESIPEIETKIADLKKQLAQYETNGVLARAEENVRTGKQLTDPQTNALAIQKSIAIANTSLHEVGQRISNFEALRPATQYHIEQATARANQYKVSPEEATITLEKAKQDVLGLEKLAPTDPARAGLEKAKLQLEYRQAIADAVTADARATAATIKAVSQEQTFTGQVQKTRAVIATAVSNVIPVAKEWLIGTPDKPTAFGKRFNDQYRNSVNLERLSNKYNVNEIENITGKVGKIELVSEAGTPVEISITGKEVTSLSSLKSALPREGIYEITLEDGTTLRIVKSGLGPFAKVFTAKVGGDGRAQSIPDSVVLKASFQMKSELAGINSSAKIDIDGKIITGADALTTLKATVKGRTGFVDVSIDGKPIRLEVLGDRVIVSEYGADGKLQKVDGVNTNAFVDDSLLSAGDKTYVKRFTQELASFQEKLTTYNEIKYQKDLQAYTTDHASWVVARDAAKASSTEFFTPEPTQPVKSSEYYFYGAEKGVKNQMPYLADAIFGKENGMKGKLYEAVTGIGKSTTLIPEIAILKANLTGKPVVIILNTPQDVVQFFEKFPAEMFKTFGGSGKALSIETFDANQPLSKERLAAANILVTTKDAIFESIRGGESASFMKKINGAVLLADEAQLTLRLEIDYVISQGEKSAVSNASKAVFDEVYNSQFFKEVRSALQGNGTTGLAKAQEIASIERVDGRGKITNVQTQERLYSELINQSAAKAGSQRQGVDDYITGYRTKTNPGATYETALTDFLNHNFVGDAKTLAVQMELRSRISTANSIINQFAQRPFTDYTHSDTRIVLAEGGAVSGRTPSRASDSLALEYVGYDVLSNRGDQSIAVKLQPEKVTVTQSNISTNYARFLNGFSEIYGFTGTPEVVRQQFDRIYGVKLGTGGMNQKDFVLGTNTAVSDHPISTIVGVRTTSDISSRIREIQSSRGKESAIELYVNADAGLPRDELISAIKSQRPDRTIIVNDPNGQHYMEKPTFDGNGNPTGMWTKIMLTEANAKSIGYSSAADLINAELNTIRSQHGKAVMLYSYGQHYGVDRTTFASEPFTIIAGPETTMTELLQSVGRDRGLNGGGANGDYSRLDVIVRGDRSLTKTLTTPEAIREYAVTKFETAEINAIKQSELQAVGRIAENIGFDVIRRMQEAATPKGFFDAITGKTMDSALASQFETIKEGLRHQTELDYSIGSSDQSGKAVVLERLNTVQKYLSDTLASIEANPALAKKLGSESVKILREAVGGKTVFTEADLVLSGDGTSNGKTIAMKPYNEVKTLHEYIDQLNAVMKESDIPETIARGQTPVEKNSSLAQNETVAKTVAAKIVDTASSRTPTRTVQEVVADIQAGKPVTEVGGYSGLYRALVQAKANLVTDKTETVPMYQLKGPAGVTILVSPTATITIQPDVRWDKAPAVVPGKPVTYKTAKAANDAISKAVTEAKTTYQKELNDPANTTVTETVTVTITENGKTSQITLTDSDLISDTPLITVADTTVTQPVVLPTSSDVETITTKLTEEIGTYLANNTVKGVTIDTKTPEGKAVVRSVISYQFEEVEAQIQAENQAAIAKQNSGLSAQKVFNSLGQVFQKGWSRIIVGIGGLAAIVVIGYNVFLVPQPAPVIVERPRVVEMRTIDQSPVTKELAKVAITGNLKSEVPVDVQQPVIVQPQEVVKPVVSFYASQETKQFMNSIQNKNFDEYTGKIPLLSFTLPNGHTVTMTITGDARVRDIQALKGAVEKLGKINENVDYELAIHKQGDGLLKIGKEGKYFGYISSPTIVRPGVLAMNLEYSGAYAGSFNHYLENQTVLPYEMFGGIENAKAAGLAHEMVHVFSNQIVDGKPVNTSIETAFINIFRNGKATINGNDVSFSPSIFNEKAPTRYARSTKNINEDFADSVTLFNYAPEYLKATSPYRYAFMEWVDKGGDPFAFSPVQVVAGKVVPTPVTTLPNPSQSSVFLLGLLSTVDSLLGKLNIPTPNWLEDMKDKENAKRAIHAKKTPPNPPTSSSEPPKETPEEKKTAARTALVETVFAYMNVHAPAQLTGTAEEKQNTVEDIVDSLLSGVKTILTDGQVVTNPASATVVPPVASKPVVVVPPAIPKAAIPAVPAVDMKPVTTKIPTEKQILATVSPLLAALPSGDNSIAARIGRGQTDIQIIDELVKHPTVQALFGEAGIPLTSAQIAQLTPIIQKRIDTDKPIAAAKPDASALPETAPQPPASTDTNTIDESGTNFEKTETDKELWRTFAARAAALAPHLRIKWGGLNLTMFANGKILMIPSSSYLKKFSDSYVDYYAAFDVAISEEIAHAASITMFPDSQSSAAWFRKVWGGISAINQRVLEQAYFRNKNTFIKVVGEDASTNQAIVKIPKKESSLQDKANTLAGGELVRMLMNRKLNVVNGETMDRKLEKAPITSSELNSVLDGILSGLSPEDTEILNNAVKLTQSMTSKDTGSKKTANPVVSNVSKWERGGAFNLQSLVNGFNFIKNLPWKSFGENIGITETRVKAVGDWIANIRTSSWGQRWDAVKVWTVKSAWPWTLKYVITPNPFTSTTGTLGWQRVGYAASRIGPLFIPHMWPVSLVAFLSDLRMPEVRQAIVNFFKTPSGAPKLSFWKDYVLSPAPWRRGMPIGPRIGQMMTLSTRWGVPVAGPFIAIIDVFRSYKDFKAHLWIFQKPLVAPVNPIRFSLSSVIDILLSKPNGSLTDRFARGQSDDTIISEIQTDPLVISIIPTLVAQKIKMPTTDEWNALIEEIVKEKMQKVRSVQQQTPVSYTLDDATIAHTNVSSTEMIGREEGAGGFTERFVSRRHASIYRDIKSNVLGITDNNSSNGTYINGKRITGYRELEVGDSVSLGHPDDKVILTVTLVNGIKEILRNGSVVRGIVITAPKVTALKEAYMNNNFEAATLYTVSQANRNLILKKAQIHATAYRGKKLTVENLYSLGLDPQYSMTIDGVEFHLSYPYLLGGGRLAYVVYIKNTDGTFVARSYYRSNSSVTWRLLPSYVLSSDGTHISWFSKGYGEEGINAPTPLQKAFSSIALDVTAISLPDPEFVFGGIVREHLRGEDEAAITYIEEIQAIPDFIEVSFTRPTKEGVLPKPETVMLKNPKQGPNFSNYIMSWDEETELFGRITKEAYVSYDGKYVWVFYRDARGRAGVSYIEDRSPISSLGIRKSWVFADPLTTPIAEYESQTKGYGNMLIRNGKYVDMYSNYLSNIQIIQDYQRSIQTLKSGKKAVVENIPIENMKKGKCSPCSIEIPITMSMLNKSLALLSTDVPAARSMVVQAKTYLDHIYENKEVQAGLDVNIEVTEAIVKPTQAERWDALQAITRAEDRIRQRLADLKDPLTPEERPVFEAYLSDITGLHDSVAGLTVTPSTWTEYVHIVVTNTWFSMRRWINTGLFQISGNEKMNTETVQPGDQIISAVLPMLPAIVEEIRVAQPNLDEEAIVGLVKQTLPEKLAGNKAYANLDPTEKAQILVLLEPAIRAQFSSILLSQQQLHVNSINWDTIIHSSKAIVIDEKNIDTLPKMQGRIIPSQSSPSIRPLYPVEVVGYLLFSSDNLEKGRLQVAGYLEALRSGKNVDMFITQATDFMQSRLQKYQQWKSDELMKNREVMATLDLTATSDSPEDLVLVRVMQNDESFQVDSRGNIAVQSAFLGQSNKDDTALFRTSKHFSINHTVATSTSQSLSGTKTNDWSENDEVLLVPYNELVKINGNPYTFLYVDTWWTPGTYNSVILPKGSVVVVKRSSQKLEYDLKLPGVVVVVADNPYAFARNVISQLGYEYKDQSMINGSKDFMFATKNDIAYSSRHFQSPHQNAEFSVYLQKLKYLETYIQEWREGSLSLVGRAHLITQLVDAGYFSDKPINGIQMSPSSSLSWSFQENGLIDHNFSLLWSVVDELNTYISQDIVDWPSVWDTQGVYSRLRDEIINQNQDPSLLTAIPFLNPQLFAINSDQTDVLLQDVDPQAVLIPKSGVQTRFQGAVEIIRDTPLNGLEDLAVKVADSFAGSFDKSIDACTGAVYRLFPQVYAATDGKKCTFAGRMLIMAGGKRTTNWFQTDGWKMPNRYLLGQISAQIRRMKQGNDRIFVNTEELRNGVFKGYMFTNGILALGTGTHEGVANRAGMADALNRVDPQSYSVIINGPQLEVQSGNNLDTVVRQVVRRLLAIGVPPTMIFTVYGNFSGQGRGEYRAPLGQLVSGIDPMHFITTPTGLVESADFIDYQGKPFTLFDTSRLQSDTRGIFNIVAIDTIHKVIDLKFENGTNERWTFAAFLKFAASERLENLGNVIRYVPVFAEDATNAVRLDEALGSRSRLLGVLTDKNQFIWSTQALGHNEVKLAGHVLEREVRALFEYDSEKDIWFLSGSRLGIMNLIDIFLSGSVSSDEQVSASVLDGIGYVGYTTLGELQKKLMVGINSEQVPSKQLQSNPNGLIGSGPAQWFENLSNATVYRWWPETRTRGIAPVLFDAVKRLFGGRNSISKQQSQLNQDQRNQIVTQLTPTLPAIIKEIMAAKPNLTDEQVVTEVIQVLPEKLAGNKAYANLDPTEKERIHVLLDPSIRSLLLIPNLTEQLLAVSAVTWDTNVGKFRNHNNGQFLEYTIDDPGFQRTASNRWTNTKTGQYVKYAEIERIEIQNLLTKIAVKSSSEEDFIAQVYSVFGMSPETVQIQTRIVGSKSAIRKVKKTDLEDMFRLHKLDLATISTMDSIGSTNADDAMDLVSIRQWASQTLPAEDNGLLTGIVGSQLKDPSEKGELQGFVYFYKDDFGNEENRVQRLKDEGILPKDDTTQVYEVSYGKIPGLERNQIDAGVRSFLLQLGAATTQFDEVTDANGIVQSVKPKPQFTMIAYIKANNTNSQRVAEASGFVKKSDSFFYDEGDGFVQAWVLDWDKLTEIMQTKGDTYWNTLTQNNVTNVSELKPVEKNIFQRFSDWFHSVVPNSERGSLIFPMPIKRFADVSELPYSNSKFIFNAGHTDSLIKNYPELAKKAEQYHVGKDIYSGIAVSDIQAYLIYNPKKSKDFEYLVEQQLINYPISETLQTADKAHKNNQKQYELEDLNMARNLIPTIRFQVEAVDRLYGHPLPGRIQAIVDVLTTAVSREAEIEQRIKELNNPVESQQTADIYSKSYQFVADIPLTGKEVVFNSGHKNTLNESQNAPGLLQDRHNLIIGTSTFTYAVIPVIEVQQYILSFPEKKTIIVQMIERELRQSGLEQDYYMMNMFEESNTLDKAIEFGEKFLHESHYYQQYINAVFRLVSPSEYPGLNSIVTSIQNEIRKVDEVKAHVEQLKAKKVTGFDIKDCLTDATPIFPTRRVFAAEGGSGGNGCKYLFRAPVQFLPEFAKIVSNVQKEGVRKSFIQLVSSLFSSEKESIQANNVQTTPSTVVTTNIQSFTARVLNLVLTPERAGEFLVGFTMMQLEIMHDMNLYPAKYGLKPSQVGTLPTNPVIAWMVDHIGDIWEISAGFIALRVGFVVLNVLLKKSTIFPVSLKGKQISEDVCFWISLLTTVFIKAIHSLGYISLFHIHDHMGNPVPGMLFGQGVAAVVLTASHYILKYRASINKFVVACVKAIISGLKRI